MKKKYKSVHVYIDKDNNLITIPTGESKRFGGATMVLDIINQLNAPYSENELETTLKVALNQCFSIEPDDTTNINPLEKHLNISGYARAVKNRKLVILKWDYIDGYYFVPTNKIPKRGYVQLEENIINLGKAFIAEGLAEKFNKVVQLSTTY